MPGCFSPHLDINMDTVYRYSRAPYGVPEQQLPEIRELLQAIAKDLDGYNNEIFRLENQLLFLKSQRERAQKHEMALRSLLSPINHLPNELLIRIFSCVCDDIFMTNKRGLLTAPFFLSAVCSRWRALCLSHSKLWSNIRFSCSRGLKLGSAVDLQLERSKRQLLTLDLSYHNDREASTLFQKVVDCSVRWQHATLSLPMLSTVSALHGRDFPALESLDFWGLPDNAGDLEVFARAPKLRSLGSDGVLIPNQVVLARITHLSYNLQAGNLHEVLNMCHDLRSLSIGDYDTFADDVSISHAPTVIPTLTSLHISNTRCDIEIFQNVLCSLTTPALDILALDHDFPDYTPETHNVIEQFLGRSGCTLTKLDIRLSLNDKDVVDLLQKLPSLEELIVKDLPQTTSTLRSRPITKAFVESLHSYQHSTLHQSPRPLLPKLRSLTLRVTSIGFDHTSFVDTITSRWLPDAAYAAKIGVSCIRFVDLTLEEVVDEADYLPLTRLKRMSLGFYLHAKK